MYTENKLKNKIKNKPRSLSSRMSNKSKDGNDRVFEPKTDDDNDDDDDDNMQYLDYDDMDITPEQSPIDDIDGDLEELITALTEDINMIDNDDGIGHLPLLQSLSDKK